MSLSLAQATKIVQNPPNRDQVRKGERQESRLRILTQAYSRDSIEKERAWQELDTFLANTLSTDKYTAIKKYFTFPLDIVNISNDILTDLYAVFNGRNAAFGVDFPQGNSRAKDIISPALDQMKVGEWIERYGKRVLKCEPNSIVVIDINEQGEPYPVYVPNCKLLGFEKTQKGEFEYVVFEHSKDGDTTNLAVYDDEYYRVFTEDKGNYTLIVESYHGLGYCPARYFYDKPLTNDMEFERSIPLSNVQGVMIQWQMFALFLYYAEYYGVFPIVEFHDRECDACEGGIIPAQPIQNDLNDVVEWTKPKECPSCAKKTLMGPGTAVGITVSEDPDIQDARGLLRFISPEVEGFRYLLERQDGRNNFIKINTVGFNNAVTKEAVNETQVRALMESKKKPLLEIRTHLNELRDWMNITSAAVAYEIEIGSHSEYGTEFFVIGESEIMLLIEGAKRAGVQSSEIAELNYMLIETKYKNNPKKAKAMKIASDLEPSPFDTRDEVAAKFASGMISREDYYIKLNFTDLVTRFENENGSLVTFGMELPYDEKLRRIKSTLLFYTNQNLESNGNGETEQIPSGGQGASD